MPLLIRNGQVVTASDSFIADIYCEDETITRIGPGLDAPPSATVVNATGKLVFPGFIDPHVHIYLPFMGTYAKDTYATESKAALFGGTTTLIEMICPSRSEEPLAAFELWKSKAAGISACDFTFHMGVTRFDGSAESQLKEIVAAGLSSFKIFLAYKGALGVDDAELFATMRLAKSLGVIVTAHCENADAVSGKQKELLAAGKTGPEWHEPSRPESVEALGVHHLMTFAAMHGTHCYIVHTSCEPAARQALAARAARKSRVDRNADPISDAGQDLRRTAGFRGKQIRHVSAAARQIQSAVPLEQPGQRLHQHRRDRSCPV